MNVQYKKGVLELCVLSLLAKQDCYGYDVSEFLSYPILRKLKAEGLVTTYLSEESGGPPRKYYKLTELGRKEYRAARQEWLGFVETVQNLLKEDEDVE